MSRDRSWILTVGLWLLVSNEMALAQLTMATVSGMVTDETGGVLPGVTVTVKNLDTGAIRTVVTDDQGRYRAPNLGLGNYELEASLVGFRTEVRRGVRLTVGREAVIDFTLKLGELTEQTVVTAEAALVDISGAALGGLVDEKRIQDLPLNGRDITQLLLLETGVTFARRGTSGIIAGFGKRVSISGMRPESTGWLLDGTDIQNSPQSGPATASESFLGIEAVQEFQVVTNSMSAEYGTVAGGVMNAVTKSGTNEFHGSVYTFHRNSVLDARNFFDVDPLRPLERSSPPTFKRNQFGLAAGGPLVRDRTFLFGNYEGLRDRLNPTLTARVPTTEARLGIIPGRPAITVHRAVKPLLDLYPLPNARIFSDGTAESVSVRPQPTDENFFNIRADHSFSEKQSFLARYTATRAERRASDSIGLIETTSRNRHQYVTLQQQSVLTPHFLNTLRLGYNRSLDADVYDALRDASALRLTPLPFVGQFSVPVIAGLGPGVTIPQVNLLNMFEVADDLIHNSGSHSIKLGALIKRYHLFLERWTRAGGQQSFSSFEDFLRGRVDSFNAYMPGTDVVRNLRQSLFGFYIQDAIRARSGLTLSLGLRYEFITSPSEIDGKLSNWRFPMDPEPTVGPMARNPSLKNFAPRLGLAWDPFGDGRTAVKAGVGVFQEQLILRAWHTTSTQQPPFVLRGEARNPPIENTFDHMAAAGRVRLETFSMYYDISQPWALQFNLSIQREIVPLTVVTVAYTGSRGTNLFRSGEANIAIPEILADGREFFRSGLQRRNPNLETDRRIWSDAKSFYNSMQFRVNRRWNQGFQVQGSYTFSKAIDDGSTIVAATLGGQHQSINPYNPRRNRGLSLFDVRHNFVMNYTWDLPFGDRPGIADGLVRGWQLGGILSLASGHPETPTLSFNRSRDLSTNSRFEVPNLKPGANKNPVLGGPDRYFDATAFELQGAGFYGNLGRNTLIGPGVATFDLAATKLTPVTALSENFGIQFRAEFFNLLNRANFGPPATGSVISSDGRPNPGAGRITRTTTSARQIQFGLKLVW